MLMKAGDAVVFDQRILHRGLYLHQMNESEVDRVAISVGYGLCNNVYTEAFKNSIMHRNKLFNNVSICGGNPHYSPCTDIYMSNNYKNW